MSGAAADDAPMDKPVDKPVDEPVDEMVDGAGRVRPHWRPVIGALAALGRDGLAGRARLLDRAFEEEGSAGLLPSSARPAPARAARRLDPVPLVLPAAEFAALADGLAQRARLLEAVLADLYGPQRLLADGHLPPELVFPSPAFLRPLRGVPTGRLLRVYAAELRRAPDGAWRVTADGTTAMEGLAQALTNRAHMARTLPELTRTAGMRPLRPFMDLWRDVLQRAAGSADLPGDETGDDPGNETGNGAAAVVLLTPGTGHPAWAQHVALARDLSCVLAEAGDLTARGGRLYLKTLRGLRPVRVLLSRIPGALLDPLELGGRTALGVPGLLDAIRAGTLLVHNHPGAGLAEAPALPAFLPALSEALLGEPLAIPSAETLWLGDPAALARHRAAPDRYEPRPAAHPAAHPAALADALLGAGLAGGAPEGDPRAWAAVARDPASLAPALAGDGRLEPRPVLLRLFLVHDGTAWHALPGGLARVVAEDGPALSKDVWVLSEERPEIRGPAALRAPALPVRRTAGDLPSRVADNLFWLGRYVERLDDGARLMRATLSRLDRAPMLPRDGAEIAALSRCLADARLIAEEERPTTGDDAALRRAMLRAGRDGGRLHHLAGEVARLVEATRDRLTGDMHAAFTLPLRDSRAALLEARGPAELAAALGGVVRYASGVAGVAAENMVRGGAHAFLDLGRRLERGAAVAALLGHLLNEAPARVESALVLALELCDSVITYRTRYLHHLQPGPALDLVLADPANPRGLAFQLLAAESLLSGVEGTSAEGAGDALSARTRRLRQDAEAMAAGVAAAPDAAAAATALSPRLLALEESVGALSDAIGRRYFTLVAAPRLLGVDTARQGAA